MKIYITATNAEAPEGFKKSHIVYGTCKIDVPDGSCTEIVVSEGIDYIKQENIEDFLKKCVSKMRQKAIITIVGTDLRGLARAVHVGEMDSTRFSQTSINFKSFNTATDIVDHLKKLGLSLISQSITNGLNYEIKATRK